MLSTTMLGGTEVMGWQGIYCLGTLVLVFWGLVRNYPADALLMGAVVALALVGIISPQEALAGFANDGMLTVGALFVVAAALRETGALDIAGAWVLGQAHTERGALLRMAFSVTGMSAFLNNTPIVAMFIPLVTDWCRRHKIEPSRLMIPLSYLTILGGTCTLIGTSTNLVVNGLMQQAAAARPTVAESLSPIRLFELSYVGIPYAIAGVAYLLLVGGYLLPRRKGFVEKFTESSREYLVNMKVQPSCKLIGKSIQGAGLRQLPGLFVVDITRRNEIISPISPSHTLYAEDVLTFTGAVSTIVDLERIPGLVTVPADGGEAHRARMLHEAVVSSASPVLGQTIRAADFRARYNAVVVAVHRGGERLNGKVGDIRVKPGDTLLLQAGPHFARANRNNPDFLLVGGLDDARPIRREKAVIALALLVLLIALMVSGIVPIVLAAFLVAALMVLARCISVVDARRSVDWQTLIAIGAAFGLSKALMNSGLVPAVAEYVGKLAQGFGPHAALAGIYLITSLVTEVVTNNAAAALVFPFAVAVASQIDVSPRPFVIAVLFAASASFITPIGYQTNMMVYGPGGYKFTDFMRVGFPLHIILVVTATILIPQVWPF